MLLGGSVSPWRSGVEEGRSPLGRFRKPEPCFPRTYATWDAKKDENRFESMKFRLREAVGFGGAQQNRILRYGRLEICVTGETDAQGAGPKTDVAAATISTSARRPPPVEYGCFGSDRRPGWAQTRPDTRLERTPTDRKSVV